MYKRRGLFLHILKTGAAGFMVQLGSTLCQAEFDLDLKNRSNPVLLKKNKIKSVS